MMRRWHWLGAVVMWFGAASLAHAQADKAQEKPKRPEYRIPEGLKVVRDVDYVGNGLKRQMLDLYVPETATGALPVVAWVHGGSWRGGSKDVCPIVELATHGYVVASINYRLTDAGPFPAQIEDCRAAIRWLRANARTHHIDPGHIGVWGASAGGHLVALLGTAADQKQWDDVGGNTNVSARVQAVCDYFGPADFLHNYNPARATPPDSPVARLLGGPISEKKVVAKEASPVTFITKDDAPFLIVHGDHDELVPLKQSELLYVALKDAGVDAELLVVKNGKHGVFTDDVEPSPAQIRQKVFGFFDRALKNGSAK